MSRLHNANLVIQSLCTNFQSYVVERHLRKAGVGHAHSIFTHTIPTELHALFYLARACSPAAHVLEIGSYLGASTCYIAAGLAQKGGTVFCVDTWSNETMPEGPRDTFAEFVANTKAVSHLLKTIRKRSEDLIEADILTPLSLVFIDGDHSYPSVSGDFSRVAGWLSSTGVIAFHDCLYHEGVSRVVGEALASGQWVLSGSTNNLSWIKRAPSSWTGTC